MAESATKSQEVSSEQDPDVLWLFLNLESNKVVEECSVTFKNRAAKTLEKKN